MTTSINKLAIVTAFGIVLVSNCAFAGFPMSGNSGSKRISINSSHISIHGEGKHIEMSPGHVSIHGSGKSIVVGSGRVSIHGNGKHVEICPDSFHSNCSSTVVYTTPPAVEYVPAGPQEDPREEVVSAPPETTVSYRPEPVTPPSPPVAPVSYQPKQPSFDPAELTSAGLEPVNSTYVIEPGDTFYEVSLKMYSTSDAAQAIAVFNRIPLDAKLRPGTVVHLPSISAEGNMSASPAPPARVQ